MQEGSYYFKFNDINLFFKKGEFVTIVGSDNDNIVSFLMHDNEIVSYKSLKGFKAETVKEELLQLIDGNEITRYLNDIDLENKNIDLLNISEKIKLKILIGILKKETIIIDNLLSLLSNSDYKLIMKLLNNYIQQEGIVLNITHNIEESIYGNRLVVIYNNQLLCNDYTLMALRQEKLLKRLGIGLPFIVELNKYLMDYGLINKYYLNPNDLVSELWK